MIVQCPECSSQYRVSDEKIPESGGKITCPQCAHVFVVYPGEGEDAGRAKTAVADQRRLQEMARKQREAGGEAGQEAGIPDPEELDDLEDEEGTVEMRNPFADQQDGSGPLAEGENTTDVLSQQNVEEVVEEAFSPEEHGEGEASVEAHTSDVDPFGDTDRQKKEALGEGGVRVDARGEGGADAGDEEPEGSWHLKAANGLTYDFPDSEALEEWLRDRADQIQGHQLAAEGGEFRPLKAYSRFAAVVEEGADRSAEFVAEQTDARPPETGPNAAVGQQIDEQAARADDSGEQAGWDRAGGQGRGQRIDGDDFELPSRESDASVLLYGVFGVLSVVAVGLALETFDIFPVSEVVPGLGSDQPAATSNSVAGGDGSAAGTSNAGDAEDESGAEARDDGQDDARDIERQLELAQKAVDDGKFEQALKKLKAARLLAPKRPDILTKLADVYEKMDRNDKAEDKRQRARELRTANDRKAGGTAQREDSGETSDEQKE